MPDSIQKQTLGTRRFELWKAGKISLKDLATKDGRLRLLKELPSR